MGEMLWKTVKNMMKTINLLSELLVFLEQKCDSLLKNERTTHVLLKSDSLLSLFCREQQEIFAHGPSFLKSDGWKHEKNTVSQNFWIVTMCKNILTYAEGGLEITKKRIQKSCMYTFKVN